MEHIGINFELTADQVKQLRSALGTEFNVVEILSAWACKKLDSEGDLGGILNCFNTEELETFRFREFNVLLTEELKGQLKWSDNHPIDEAVYEILGQLTKRNPKTEPLSQTEVDAMLMDIEPGGHSHGPSGIFSCNKLFTGSAPQMELAGVQVVIRALLFREISKLAKKEGLNSVEELIRHKLLAFSPVGQKT